MLWLQNVGGLLAFVFCDYERHVDGLVVVDAVAGCQ